MPKSSEEQIKVDENKVLFELQKNSKESIDNIAKKCGFSRQKVWRIIKRLEKNNTIIGYTSVVDEKMQNLIHFTMLIKRSSKPLPENIVDKICEQQVDGFKPNVSVIIDDSYYTHGEYDWIVTLKAVDLKQVKKFSEFFISQYNEYVKEIKILETLFFIRKNGIIHPQCIDFKKYL
jgi:DNA-binding Lrp family transcriptional regulator